MKKMFFAVTIATGLLTASLANAQTEKKAPKTKTQAPAKSTKLAPKMNHSTLPPGKVQHAVNANAKPVNTK